MVQNFYLATVCAATYGTLFAFIVIQSRQTTNVTLAGCCAITSSWAAMATVWPEPEMNGLPGFLDTVRMLSWYVYLLHLYKRSDVAPKWQIRSFVGLAIGAAAVAALGALGIGNEAGYSLLSIPIATKLLISVAALLLIENLYSNLPEYARWHVALPCVLLGGISCFDTLISADAVLFHRPSVPLVSARMIVMIVFAPILVLAAFRGQRWNEPVRLSRTAAFHSATLVLSGSVLLALALAGELLRRLDDELGWIAELSLVFSGLLGVLLFLSSRSARSVVQRIVTRHFFADRYDYRLQWLQCISTLSGTASAEKTSLPTRAIRTVADVVNSPNGALLMLDPGAKTLSWMGSWNMPSLGGVPTRYPALEQAVESGSVVVTCEQAVLDLGPVWLAVPLTHTAGVIGLVIVGPPRVPFRLDQEVFELLHIIGREVATYVTEQRATEEIMQNRDLHDYSKKFAFVAHDIKNVSSQLALLLSNAENHLDNPEFQQDMLETVRASVRKIDALLRRLDQRSNQDDVSRFDVADRIKALLEEFERMPNVTVNLNHHGSVSQVVANPEKLDTVMTHLINNAVEAGSQLPVEINVQGEGDRIIVDVVDRGKGMSAAFIRDHLFTPFKSDKEGGSGIGAYQARELVREIGGQLLVTSEPGRGTTMRVVLPGMPSIATAALQITSLSTGDPRG